MRGGKDIAGGEGWMEEKEEEREGGEIVGGLYGLAKKASIGFPAALMAGFGDF